MKIIFSTLAAAAILCFGCNRSKKNVPDADWPKYGGNNFGNRYSPLDQINKNNVKDLKVAWVYDTGDNKDSTKRGQGMQCQPIVVHGVMYGVSPKLKAFAVDPTTGKELWRFESPTAILKPNVSPQ